MTLDLAFLVAGLPFQGDSLERHSLGGSETAGLCLARAMAALGHQVVMFSHCEQPGHYDGVLYRKLEDFADYAQSAPHDVTIVQRLPEVFRARLNSRLNVLWCHDLAVGRRGDLFRATMWNVDKIAVLSDFMRQQYAETYHLPPETLWQTRNGIDLALFGSAGPRDRQHLVFGARPERGLDILLDRIFPTLLMKRSQLTLSIATYDNSVRELQGFYAHIQERIAQFGGRVVTLPPMPKRQYYAVLARAGVYVYPTPSPTAPTFAEVSCITAMECQAAGLPIVTSRRGALAETIGEGAGTLIDGDPSSDRYVEEFCDAVLRYVRDDAAFQAAGAAGRRQAATLDWSGVAEQWSEDLARFIVERNDSPRRLVQHFIRRSDIMAAKSVIDAMPPGPEATELATTIELSWSFAESATGLREQYEQIGQTHTDVFASVPHEARFMLLEQWLREHPDVQRILDYGCAHGAYTVNLANRVGREWLGVDIDQHSIRWCEYNRTNRADRPASLQFRVGTDDIDLSDVPPFDCLVAFEVLEHVPDPASVIDHLERWVKPDGTVLITVPFGPWEWQSYRTYPYRCHLWEFDLHDLRDLFGKKKDVRISVMSHGTCEPLGERLGWHIIEYRVDGTPTGTIDMARKTTLQRPRQSVSALLVAGPGCEATLGWALEPLRDLVDEIVIGDTGMSDLAKQIAATYEATIVPAADPIAHGFEAPRNDALEHVRSDWVLCVDTDERLVGAPKLNKYLRANLLTGYNIKQHNFSCDAPHESTLPVRCFRRAPRSDGKTLRWFGMIHEHPEYALNEGPGTTIILCDVHLAHVGYLSGADQVARFYRNLPLLKRDSDVYPDRKLQKHFLCRDLITAARWTLEGNGGIVTPEVEAQCREVVRLYREHFLGVGMYLNVDTLQYYSTALTILGEGVEVAFHFGSDPNGENHRARFATAEEAEREIAWRIRETMAPRLSPWW